MTGDKFPTSPQHGDEYYYGDYKYTYNGESGVQTYSAAATPNVTGWWVQVVDKDKTSYGQILESICNVPVTSMFYTFSDCYYLIDASSIHIPSGVVEAEACFSGCDNLTTAPELVSSLKDISYMFSYCRSLTGDIVVNCEPDSYEGCFNSTSNSITLSGSSSKKAEIAATITEPK